MNNPILVRDDVKVLGSEARKMCDAVGDSPARSVTCVKYERGHKRAHLCGHDNAHIQEGPNNPHELPRVKEAIRFLLRLEAWIGELQAAGYEVTFSGDLNWSWSKNDDHDWHYSPEKVFDRAGMTTTFEHKSNPAGGTLGSRDIDYIAYDPDDLEVIDQEHVAGEHSDHRWLFASLRTR